MRRPSTIRGGVLLAWGAFLRLTWAEDRPLAPTFTLPDLQGQPVSLAAYRGKLVLINFWATWCRECIWEMPELETLARALNPQELVVLWHSTDLAKPWCRSS
ncbi:peroxiredoxin family protein [Nitrospira sp. Kam-Ns4a]